MVWFQSVVSEGLNSRRNHCFNQFESEGKKKPKAQSGRECVCVCVCVCSAVSQHFATPWTVAYQTPLSVGFPSQEY